LAVALAREAEAYRRLSKEIRPTSTSTSESLETPTWSHPSPTYSTGKVSRNDSGHSTYLGIYLSFVIHARFPST